LAHCKRGLIGGPGAAVRCGSVTTFRETTEDRLTDRPTDSAGAAGNSSNIKFGNHPRRPLTTGFLCASEPQQREQTASSIELPSIVYVPSLSRNHRFTALTPFTVTRRKKFIFIFI